MFTFLKYFSLHPDIKTNTRGTIIIMPEIKIILRGLATSNDEEAYMVCNIPLHHRD